MEKLVHVTAVEVVGDYRLRLNFEDGIVGDVDFSDREWRGAFEPLSDPVYFARVRVPGNVLQRLFAAPDPGGDIDRSGLEAQPEGFFPGSMKPKLMAASSEAGTPFRYRDSDPLWHGPNTDCKAPP